MNLIAQYEQGYLSLSEFVNEFPDSISESQEALFGARCVEFYVAVTLGKTDCRYYVQAYGGDNQKQVKTVLLNFKLKFFRFILDYKSL